MSFDPNSTDAMFAKVLSKLEEQSAMLTEMRENGRVIETEIAGLKSWRDTFEGKVTVIAALVSAGVGIAITIVLHFLK